ncbi:hypothetical protein DIPPA_01983 [Diplonema papillatum]|nr:hypothetical protein DIPPA_01983 [Diplonema papillatum]
MCFSLGYRRFHIGNRLMLSAVITYSPSAPSDPTTRRASGVLPAGIAPVCQAGPPWAAELGGSVAENGWLLYVFIASSFSCRCGRSSSLSSGWCSAVECAALVSPVGLKHNLTMMKPVIAPARIVTPINSRMKPTQEKSTPRRVCSHHSASFADMHPCGPQTPSLPQSQPLTQPCFDRFRTIHASLTDRLRPCSGIGTQG